MVEREVLLESIKCPRLNIHYGGNGLGIFVKFESHSEKMFSDRFRPTQIMCDEYNESTAKCKINSESCTYKMWKRIR